MPRINVYVPRSVHELASQWRDRVNLSEICSRALMTELSALENHQSPGALLRSLQAVDPMEKDLQAAFGLADVRLCHPATGSSMLRESLGSEAALYLNRYLTDGSVLGISGGRQTWCTVRNIVPREIAINTLAIGIHQSDPQVLHVHPNSLVTVLSLLFSPRGRAHLVGAEYFRRVWNLPDTIAADPKYFILASCGAFHSDSKLATLLGDETSVDLSRRGAMGDYCYVFFGANGEPIDLALEEDASVLSYMQLRALSKRPDTRVMLVAGGQEKTELIRLALGAGVCNTLITDSSTAELLLNGS